MKSCRQGGDVSGVHGTVRMATLRHEVVAGIVVHDGSEEGEKWNEDDGANKVTQVRRWETTAIASSEQERQ